MSDRLPLCKNCGKPLDGPSNDYRGPHWTHYDGGTKFDCSNPTVPMPPDDYEPKNDRERQATERYRR